MRKPVFGVSDQDTNRALLQQKTARGLKFRIKEVVELYYPEANLPFCLGIDAKIRFSLFTNHICCKLLFMVYEKHN